MRAAYFLTMNPEEGRCNVWSVLNLQPQPAVVSSLRWRFGSGNRLTSGQHLRSLCSSRGRAAVNSGYRSESVPAGRSEMSIPRADAGCGQCRRRVPVIADRAAFPQRIIVFPRWIVVASRFEITQANSVNLACDPRTSCLPKGPVPTGSGFELTLG